MSSQLSKMRDEARDFLKRFEQIVRYNAVTALKIQAMLPHRSIGAVLWCPHVVFVLIVRFKNVDMRLAFPVMAHEEREVQTVAHLIHKARFRELCKHRFTLVERTIHD
jgi:hypothetical protein